ncbi:hypothetical protein E2C01_034349 [Portunus trituberculatus]|uniref:Uncharacterized protein n=1 Tax=Portunus trituberculatus TaxID=210409 RepID=A0A5B7F1D6_PORTR|nr:hypothetical protein [Portunus trituberculatus]
MSSARVTRPGGFPSLAGSEDIPCKELLNLQHAEGRPCRARAEMWQQVVKGLMPGVGKDDRDTQCDVMIRGQPC